jgi:hypothetical protein
MEWPSGANVLKIKRRGAIADCGIGGSYQPVELPRMTLF